MSVICPRRWNRPYVGNTALSNHFEENGTLKKSWICCSRGMTSLLHCRVRSLPTQMMNMKKLRKSFWSDMQRQPVSYRKKLLRRLRMARMRMAMKLSLVCDIALFYCNCFFLLIFALFHILQNEF